jgi:nitroreductase
MRHRFGILLVLACAMLVSTVLAAPEPAPTPSPAPREQEPAPVALPAPQRDGGKPLMQALALRATSRAFAPDPLPAQTLSNLLWAAWGINRPAEGKRTAPSARNWQEIDVYVVMASGAYRYDASGNVLKPVAAGDLRALGGSQEFVKDAPVTLVLVADTRRMKGAAAEMQQAYAWGDAAFVSENVYLFCASEGLATGVRASVDRTALGKALKLEEGQIIAFAQSVGFPKK